nr:carbamoyltransferase C-terminal domain-containing protein [Streptomyces sp. NRRL S-495]
MGRLRGRRIRGGHRVRPAALRDPPAGPPRGRPPPPRREDHRLGAGPLGDRPRALGNRSILAAPFTEETTARLNRIKQRESYRPIAPICLEQEAGRWFGGGLPDPYMLYFSRVESADLRAVTHVDGTARTQTVDPAANPAMGELLTAFGELTGFSVLCNTSLNYSGRGFINRSSDLIAYGELHGLDGYVVNDVFVTPRR